MTIQHQTIHVAEPDLMPFETGCPICGTQAERKPILEIQTNPSVTYLNCPRCGGCSVSRMPTNNFLSRYYSSYYGDSETKVEFVGHERFCRHLLRLAPEIRTFPSLRILDFGGGDGTLSLTLARTIRAEAEIPVRIDVVDYSANQSIREGGIEMMSHQTLETVEGKFQLVVASAVLEHLPNCGEILKKLLDALAPGAFFYARTPYSLPLKRVFGNYDLYFPMHLHDLGPEFWGRIKDTLNFQGRIVASRPSIVQTEFRTHPLQTFMAEALKFPAHLQQRLTGTRLPSWKFVGGWEVVLQGA